MNWWTVVGILLALYPLASFVSYARSMQRFKDRQEAKRAALGLNPELEGQRRWKDYSRDTHWGRRNGK